MGMIQVKYKDAYASAIRSECDQLTEYVTEIHKSLAGSHKALEKSVAEAIDKTEDEDAQQEIAISFLDPEHNLLEVFPAMFSAATFVSIYSYLEHEMVGLCKDIEKRRKLSIALDDLAGAGIDQAAKYLEKICAIKEPKKGAAWSEIKHMQHVRNALVHRRGIMREKTATEDPEKAMREYVNSRPAISINSAETLVLTKDYCLHAVKTIRDYLLETVGKLPDTETFEERAR